MTEDIRKIRVDKWLWQARFFKTRSLAAKLVTAGHLRVNGNRVSKAAFAVGLDDVLTFPKARRIRVVRILAVGERRGPAPEAQGLYEDLSDPVPESGDIVPAVPKYEGKGRPTKRDRRKLDLKRSDPLD